MEALRLFLNSISRPEQEAFAARCGTSLGYLRKAISVKPKLSESLVIALERESEGKVPCEAVRPDVDWAYLRSRGPEYWRRRLRKASKSTSTESVAS